MMFDPFVVSVSGPMNTGAVPSGDTTSETPSVLHPISRVCNLSLVPSVGYQDFFLYHPYDGTLESLYVSSVPAANVAVSVQLIQIVDSGVKQLGAKTDLPRLTASGQEIVSSGTLGEGPVFLRVFAAPSSTNILATIHVLSSEIQ